MIFKVGFRYNKRLDLSRLQHSFQQTIDIFPPLTARFDRKNNCLRCENDGCLLDLIYVGLIKDEEFLLEDCFLPIQKEKLFYDGFLVQVRITFGFESTSFLLLSPSHSRIKWMILP